MPDDWTPVGGWIRVAETSSEENQVKEVITYCVQRKYWIARWYIVHAKSAFKGEHQKDLDIAVETCAKVLPQSWLSHTATG